MTRSKLVVFLIEYDDATRVTHETILRTEGYEILSTSDGTRALELLREQAPDLLVVGHKIGSITPTQLIRMVKNDSALSSVPVLACVPAEDVALRADLLRAGADAAIGLNVVAPELMREVIHLIGRP